METLGAVCISLCCLSNAVPAVCSLCIGICPGTAVPYTLLAAVVSACSDLLLRSAAPFGACTNEMGDADPLCEHYYVFAGRL